MKKTKTTENSGKLAAVARLGREASGRLAFIEIHGDSELLLSGCKGIIDYDGEKIVADTLSGLITVCGRKLCLDVFRGDILTVTGIIHSVSLSGGVAHEG